MTQYAYHNEAIWHPPTLTTVNEYWQIDLLVRHEVTAVGMQGRHLHAQWITYFEAALSNDSFTWQYALNANGGKKVSISPSYHCGH